MLSTIALISRLAREISGRERFNEMEWKLATAEAVRLIAEERAKNPDHADDYSAAQAILAAMPPEKRNHGVQPHPHAH